MKLESVYEKVRRLRASPEYRRWRENVIKRDGSKCVLCQSSENIEVDHIKPLSLFPKLALDLNNGRVLCKKCHKKTDTYGSLSKFKGDEPIHPILAGDLLHRIKSLPLSIGLKGKQRGFFIKYEPKISLWMAGYGKINSKSESIEESIEKLFAQLKKASQYDTESKLLDKLDNIMKNESTKEIRHQFYTVVETLLNRPLKDFEKQELGKTFMECVKVYSREVIIHRIIDAE